MGRLAFLAAAGFTLLQSAALAAPPSTPSAPAQAAAERRPNDMLLAADVDALVTYARRPPGSGVRGVQASMVVAIDDVSRGHPKAALDELDAAPPALRRGLGDLLEMWIFLAQGDSHKAHRRAEDAQTRLPAALAGVAPALVLEASGRLKEAASAYDSLVASFDLTPPREGEAVSPADLGRRLEAPRTAQTLYRAGVVHHRLGQKEEARRLYRLAEKFAPNSPDVAANLERLDRGAAPWEAKLTPRTGFGRWLLFLSYDLTMAETLRAAIASPVPSAQLTAPTGMIYALLGLRLDPGAHDWLVSTAGELASAKGYAGAEKLLQQLPADSVFAADGEIVRARAALQRKQDPLAAAAAGKAAAAAPARWVIAGQAGLVLALVGQDKAAMAALDSMVARAPAGADRARALLSRAQAHFQAGRRREAAIDARAAMAADASDAVRASAAAFLASAPDGWGEAVGLNRALLEAQPNSPSRMNGLGYTLIQRESSLEEGFKLLRRGVALYPDGYDIVDSLGWAYYLYGDFETARKLVAQAHELSGDEPNAEVLDHLGDIYWRLDRKEDARQAWKEALEARPDAQRRDALAGKVANGLAGAAPKKREPPDVDLRPRKSAPANPI